MRLLPILIETLSGRFEPVAERAEYEEQLTLYAAVKSAIGMDPDAAIIGYREHRQIRLLVRSFYAALTSAVDGIGEPWAMRPDRTELEVLDVLGRMTGSEDLMVPETVTARPGLKRLAGSGRLRSVLSGEVAAIANYSSADFYEVMRSVVDAPYSDAELLERVDSLSVPSWVNSEIDWKEAKAFAVRAGDFLRSAPGAPLSAFVYTECA